MPDIKETPKIEGYEFTLRISRWVEIDSGGENASGTELIAIFYPDQRMISEFFNSGMLNVYGLTNILNGLEKEGFVHSMEGPSIVPIDQESIEIAYPNDEEYGKLHSQIISRKVMRQITEYLLTVAQDLGCQ